MRFKVRQMVREAGWQVGSRKWELVRFMMRQIANKATWRLLAPDFDRRQQSPPTTRRYYWDAGAAKAPFSTRQCQLLTWVSLAFGLGEIGLISLGWFSLGWVSLGWLCSTLDERAAHKHTYARARKQILCRRRWIKHLSSLLVDPAHCRGHESYP